MTLLWIHTDYLRRRNVSARQHTLAVLVVATAFLAVAAHGDARRTTGLASWYGTHWNGRRTAAGCIFHADRLSAASRTLPLGTWIRVRNLRNGRVAVLQIQDRGPYIAGRVLDLSQAAARVLGAIEAGVVPVSIEILPGQQPARRCH